MKKRTVITTEKREVWVVREVTPEAEQFIDASNEMEPESTDHEEQSDEDASSVAHLVPRRSL